MRLSEALVFLSLATGLHAGLWAVAPETAGQSATGGTGRPQVTLAAAAPRQAALARAWSRPPDVAAPSDQPMVPADQAAPQQPAALQSGPVLHPAPHLSAITPAALPRSRPAPLPHPATPRSAPPETMTAPEVEQAEAPLTRPHADRRPPPEARPDPVQAPPPDQVARIDTTPPPPPRPKPAPKPRQAQPQQAPATGGGNASARAKSPGNTAGSAQSHTREAANANALISGWGAKIQRRVHRRVITPRGVPGSGTVRLALSVGRDGRLTGVRVVRSSGIAAFDKAALGAVRRAGRFPAAPRGLSKPSYRFTLSLAFRG